MASSQSQMNEDSLRQRKAATTPATDNQPSQRKEAPPSSGRSKSKRRKKRSRRPAPPSGDVTGAGKRLLGTRWAPINVPTSRRLQTFAVLLALTLMPMNNMMLLCMFFVPFLRQFYSREIVIALLVWTFLIDRKTPVSGGRPFWSISRWRIWRHMRQYYPARLVVTEKMDPEAIHIFGLHPHGIIGAGIVANLVCNGDEPREQLGISFRILTVTFNFIVPLWRDFVMALGFVSASRESVRSNLKQRINTMIVIGGALESLDARPGLVDLTIDRRTGFVRLALEAGAKLCPVYTYGENELWDQVPNPEGSFVRRVQNAFLRLTGFTAPLFYGRGIFQYGWGILPHRRPLTTVVGSAITLPKIEKPTKEDVDKYHKLYVEALRKLYESHRKEFEHPVDRNGNPIQTKGFRIVG